MEATTALYNVTQWTCILRVHTSVLSILPLPVPICNPQTLICYTRTTLVFYSPHRTPTMKAFRFIALISTITAFSSAYGFNPKEQRIDVNGEHRFIAPDLKKDYRGPCPALNALTNHGYIPRNGIASTDQIIAGQQTLMS